MPRKSLNDRATMVLNPQAAKGYAIRIERTEKEKIAVATKVCNVYATGKYTLESVCDRFNVKHITFLQWARPTFDIASLLVRGESLPARCIVQVHEMYKKAQKTATNMYLADLKEKSRTGLLKLVEGVEYEETTEEMEIDTIQYLPDGEDNPTFGQMVVKKRKIKKGKHKPDTGAVIFALTNVDNDNFKNQKYTSNTVKVEELDKLNELSDEDLENKQREIELKLIRIAQQKSERPDNEDYEEANIVDDDELDDNK